MFGFAGRILHVDLTTGHPDVEEPPEERCRTYLGGSALGLYHLLRNTPAGVDPYGPEITLAFMLSGVTGGSVAGQSRCTAVAKSPLTGAVQDTLGSAPGTLRSAERRTAASRPTHRCLPTRRAQVRCRSRHSLVTCAECLETDEPGGADDVRSATVVPVDCAVLVWPRGTRGSIAEGTE